MTTRAKNWILRPYLWIQHVELKGNQLFWLQIHFVCWPLMLITALWPGDSSKLSLKAVFLPSGNTLHSIPVGHSVHNESYENMKILIEAINYDKLKWQICGDLKVIALLLGLQQGFTKYCCFICEWDTRGRALHYSRKDWPGANFWNQESWLWKINH